MKIAFHGAARTVTGSKHLIHLYNGKQVLLDCGMFQGLGKETAPLNENFGFDPTKITHVIISHAHIDHVGLLPKLCKEGYAGKIYCTEATAALAILLLRDSAHIQELDLKFLNKNKGLSGTEMIKPLYTTEDVEKMIDLFEIKPMNEWYKVDEDLSVMHTEAGHIIGSTCVHLKVKDHEKTARITFSGDIGRYNDAILQSPAPFPQADVIIMESTYGDKKHPDITIGIEELLQHIVDTCVHKKGKLIIPSFSVGRTQELLFAFNQLYNKGLLPKVDFFLDSPLSIKATALVKKFPNLFNKTLKKVLETDEDPFDFPNLTFIDDVEMSKSLNFRTEPCVIISASGMAEAGRVKHHIANNILIPNNKILMVGYCEPNSLGGRLKLHPEEVTIFGQKFAVNAEIASIEHMSAHGDYDDMSQWLSCQDPRMVKKLFLVHGEYEVQEAFKVKLLKKGFTDVMIPDMHEEIGLGALD